MDYEIQEETKGCDRSVQDHIQETRNTTNTDMKKKEMIKRADGSVSQRGLWDNIRANKGSGKAPAKEMLKQEKIIKGKKK